jgi:peptide/nickel transport system permease protein
MLLFTFSVKLKWFPNSLTDLTFPIAYKDPIGWASRMFLPWMTLALVSAAIYTRYSRAQVLEIGSEDYVRTARAKGLPERTVMRKHVLRAALAPLVTLAALDFAGLLGGAVFTESIFGLPGMGRMAINSVTNIDLPIITALTLVAAGIVILANMIVDILYAILDPRVRSV